MDSKTKLIGLVKDLSSLDKSEQEDKFAEIFCQIVDLTKDYTEPNCVIRGIEFPALDLSDLLSFGVNSVCGIKFIDCDLRWTKFDVCALINVEFQRCILNSDIKDILLNNVVITGKGSSDCYNELSLDNVRLVNSSIYGSRIHDAILCGTTISCI